MYTTVTIPENYYVGRYCARAEAGILKDQVILIKDKSGKRVLVIMANIIIWIPLH